MAFLVILKDHRPLLRFPLEKEKTRIGRGNHVDLFVPDARVSRLHFVIQRHDDDYRLIDHSTNGTWLNGVASREAALKDQDIITAGTCQIRFELEHPGEPPTTACAVPEGGALSYDSQCDRLLYARPVLWVNEGLDEPRRLPVRRDTVRIGSERGSDVVLPAAAPRHCQLLATSDGFLLRNLQPDHPPLIDERPVRTERPVSYGSTIRIGRTSLRLAMEEGEEPLIPLKVPLYEGMVGTTKAMHRLFALIDRFSRHDAPVILLGETGTGKELVARALHRRGHRARGPFVAINCSAISPQLFESELFGHERGAFTGAIQARCGALEAAHKGTLFLDELGDMPLELQAKLLRVLETSTVTPVGSHQPRPIDVRVVAATHKNLQKAVEEGRFRADLFYRLFVLTIELPALRHRMEDLPALVRHFLDTLAVTSPPPRVTSSALARLASYPWPGNIRELRHALTRALASLSGPELTEQDLSFLSPPSGPLPDELEQPGSVVSLEEMERRSILHALRVFNGNRKEAARALGIARSTLHLRLKKYGIELEVPEEGD